ncbi:MAG: dihydroxyacetone kinase subunit DhaK [Anaerococcus vaginalis]|uniref:dihydroxyacetone kinase subunit DhaK n=1 Tax=Anaerococcus TaxID=165779 RepID=UPI0008A65F5E|nr:MULTISPECIES: dihydroxyacetone kinase subunit DhaK [Anaerococcus]MDU4378318.1 dihydroxyacetone kinase subunit DhaK [Anaerococcus vaginalis]MDU5085645.1 dihydroxyacetone kinase subunit DhaK [Anaerococcus vaginalis]MDU5823460.1 dihydroxyacetone kinase subunit DhaK [Anaerococcus vaginalis]MDU7142541.1 dihydroxyacetone kinase subunit DhaK [Anaerococcus vaginalis]OFJ67912.1 dihydroxyacetone kinase [Anaerococcus sp. HMSC065G05]
MKKIINDKDKIISQMLNGLQKANEDKVKINEELKIVYRKDLPIKGKVGLISGGGSGHEPAHAGYVGDGMLDCAICGEIFTSPTPDQVLEAIKLADSGEGVFMVIKNYTGDVMNFEMAKDMAEMEGINVDYIIVNDDVAVEDSTYTTGRRGIAGTIFVHKVLGAMARSGKNLNEMKAMAEKIVKNIKSMGMATKACINPISGKESFDLSEEDMEIGVGIHGEPGVKQEKIKTADEISKELLDHILEDFENLDGDFVLMVNGMGQTTEMELFIVNNFASDYLKEKNINIKKTFLGNFMTSMDMAGFSLTLFKVDDEILKLLEENVDIVRG